MSLFDRIFGRKVSSTNLDPAPPLGEPTRPIDAVPISFNEKVEEHQAAEEPLKTDIASLSQVTVEGSRGLLSDLPQVIGEVAETKKESSDWHDLPNADVAQDALPQSYVNLPISPDPLVRESNFQGQLQPIADIRSDVSRINSDPDRLPTKPAKEELTVFEQLKRRIDELEIENAAIRNKESEELGLLRIELSQQQKQIVEENERLEKRIQDIDAQSRRLAEREATVWKNFSELQRREKLIVDRNPVRSDASLTEEVKLLRAQIDSGTFSAKKRETTLVEEIKILTERVSSDANTAFRKQMAMQEQLDQADRSIQNLLTSKTELERSIEAQRQRGSPPLKKTKREFHFDSTLIAVSDHRIIDWMLEGASPEQADVHRGYLSLTGEGPWSDYQIRELMESAGFSLWMLPDSEVDHVVVGRDSWDMSAIEQQIEAMEGRQLRIYSQEMWFAKLATGRDPFDSGDHELLMAFAKGHPALEYLIDRDTPWPEVSSGELVLGDGVFTEGIEFGVNSPLRNFGYQVGVSSGLSVDERRALLAKFLEAKNLIFDGDASAEYRSHWGKPRSVQRLFRIASHIRWLIGFQGKSPYREQANDDWRGDLLWLKKTYYKSKLHKFQWPGV